MGFLNKLIGGVAVAPIEAVGNVITGIFGDKSEKLSHEQIMAKLAQAPGLAQVELNKVEAGHRSIFVAGWRPAIGWVCACALGWHYVGSPFVAVWIKDMPDLETGTLMELVIAMLGMGALRTTEKLMGKTR